jgi:activator of HSP90 ATPase
MRELRQKYHINAGPEEVFNALTNPLAIELWSGYPAVMSTREGEEFSLWDGDITGLNLEMVPNKKIVQEWFFGEQKDKSIVTILLKEKGKQTLIELHHSNIPDNDFNDIEQGWKEYYWTPVKKYFK